jgi:hypothetical protein
LVPFFSFTCGPGSAASISKLVQVYGDEILMMIINEATHRLKNIQNQPMDMEGIAAEAMMEGGLKRSAQPWEAAEGFVSR